MGHRGNVRQSMGPVRWWFFERQQRKAARYTGYRVARSHGRELHDYSSLSSKLDPELGDIFQQEYAAGYAAGDWVNRIIMLVCSMPFLAFVMYAVVKSLGLE